MPVNPTIGVVVPIFNEEEYLEQSLERLLKIEEIKQIILVDDCSTDSSFELALNFESKYQKISSFQLDKNSGKGHAVQLGATFLSTDYLIVHDADLEYFPEDIVEMYNEAIKLPESLIIGSRVNGDKERTNIYYSTYIGNKIFAYIFSILNQTKLSDIASCYWLINLTTFRGLNLNEKGFAIEVEVLSKFLLTGSTIKEVPIKYEARSYENGKKIKLKDAISIFYKIIKYSKLFNS
jgi:dolichol-phosphate mannosyltransferase